MVLLSSNLELHKVIMSYGKLVGRETKMIRSVLKDVVVEAINHAPFFIILDDLDGLIMVDGPGPTTTIVAVFEFLDDIIDLC
jgi:hypothetical protein